MTEQMRCYGAPTPPSPGRPSRTGAGAGRHHDAADALLTRFQLAGYAASAACDGEQALAAVERVWPPPILMELGMPGGDGDETARRIGQRTAQARFDHHVRKPVDFDAIATVCLRHL